MNCKHVALLYRGVAALCCAFAVTSIASGQLAPADRQPVGPRPVPRADKVADSVRVDPLYEPFFHKDTDAPIARPKHPPIDKIPPMPMPEHRPSIPNELLKNTVTVYNAKTNEAHEIPLGDPSGLPSGVGGSSYEGMGAVDFGNEMSRGFGTMSTVSDATLQTYPARANVKLVMHFIAQNGTDQYYVCSGSMQDPGVVVTAAHCVYGRDMGANPDIFDWAQEIWVYPAWDGAGDAWPPGPDSDEVLQYYGWAVGYSFLAGTDYVNNGNSDRDCGLIRLNRTNTRSVGILTGSYGWSWGNCDTGVTNYNYSYPAESCSGSLHTGAQMYFWSGTPDGCPGVFNGNQVDLDTSSGCLTAVWGGMSGSGMYYLSGGSRYVQAVCSTSNRSTDANYCALWEQFTIDLGTFQDDTRGGTTDLEALRFRTSDTTLTQGQTTSASVVLANCTNANPASRTVTFRVYLSSNNNISDTDTLLGTYNATLDFGAVDAITVNIGSVTVPYGIATGTYWIGAIIDTSEDTNANNNDTDTWDAQQVSVSCFALTAPTAVISTDAVYCDRVRTTWNASTGASQYFVYRNTTNSTAGATLLGTTSSLFYDDFTAASNGTGYYYWIRADSNCTTSGYSAAGYGFRNYTPAIPTGVAATDGVACDSTTISWNASTQATLYRIYRNSVNNSATATQLGTDTASPFVDATGVAGTVYYYWVKAENSCGTSGFSSANTGYGESFPSVPANVQATDGTLCTGVAVTWNAVSNADTYNVYRNTVNNSGTATLLASPAVTNYTDNTAAVGPTYYYWVRANNICGLGGFSTVNTGYRGTVPAAATNVAASDATNCDPAITVTWTASPTASAFQIYRNTVNNSATATLLATVFAPANSYADGTAAANTPYYFWVRATNACGAGAFSAPDIGNRGTAPAAPAAISATDGTTCNSVSVGWLTVPGATGYQIFRNSVNNSATAVMINTDTAPPYVDNTVVGTNVYFYWVKATSSCGNSGFSPTNSGFAGSTIAFITQPSDVSVFEGQDAQFTVDVGGATTYRWYKGTTALADGGNISGSATDTLTIFGATAADEGLYSCAVTSPCGNAVSNRARLTVNGIPCPADFNQDGGIDGTDVQAFFAAWEAGDPSADVNFDGGVDGPDVDYFFGAWEAGGCG